MRYSLSAIDIQRIIDSKIIFQKYPNQMRNSKTLQLRSYWMKYDLSEGYQRALRGWL